MRREHPESDVTRVTGVTQALEASGAADVATARSVTPGEWEHVTGVTKHGRTAGEAPVTLVTRGTRRDVTGQEAPEGQGNSGLGEACHTCHACHTM